MPIFKFRCPACDHEDRVERPLPPKHCPECGSLVIDVKEVPSVPVESSKTPPEDPDMAGLRQVAADHAVGKACKYGCIPPTVSKCERCAENKCSERVSDYRRHWKRRKVVRVFKALIGRDVADIVADPSIWKSIARGRAEKLLDALGIEGTERAEMLADLESGIDRTYERLKRKLK